MSASEAASKSLAPFGLKAEPPKPLNVGVRPALSVTDLILVSCARYHVWIDTVPNETNELALAVPGVVRAATSSAAMAAAVMF